MKDINFKLKISDWEAFQKYYLNQSKTFKRSKTIIALMMPILFLVLAIGELSSTGSISTITWMYGVAAALSSLLFPKWLTNRTINKVKKSIESDSNIFGEHTLIFSNNGIKHQLQDATQNVNWNQITDIINDKNHTFLLNSNQSAIIIPLESVENPNEVNEFILSNWNKSKQ